MVITYTRKSEIEALKKSKEGLQERKRAVVEVKAATAVLAAAKEILPGGEKADPVKNSHPLTSTVTSSSPRAVAGESDAMKKQVSLLC